MPPKKSEKDSKVRQDFLSSFVKSLVLNSISKQEIEEIRKEKGKLRQNIENVRQKIQPPQIYLQQTQMMPSMMHSLKSPLPAPPYNPPQLPPGKRAETINLGKLTQILLDPSVLSIECPGTEKNLLVNRSGSVQTSGIALTKQEINFVVDEFSEKTRIPFGIGVFKAAFQDLIMTAVISEYVGTRFIIQKKTPFSN